MAGIKNVFAMCLFFSLTTLVATGAEPHREFADYPVDKIYDKLVVQPKPELPRDRPIIKYVRQAAKEKPNFAGHLVVKTFSCGKNCLNGLMIDGLTGEVIWFPEQTICIKSCDNAVSFRLDSNLIIFKGLSDGRRPNAEYDYKFTGLFTNVGARALSDK